MNSIRVLLSVTTNFDWPLYQLDVKNIFLNVHLKGVYMEVPLGLGRFILYENCNDLPSTTQYCPLLAFPNQTSQEVTHLSTTLA
jgi:hypothetical protein